MEESTTEADLQDTQALDAQPVEQPAEADTTPTNEPTEGVDETPEAADDVTTPDDEFDYDTWLEKKGIDPSTPEGKAAIAKSWRAMEQKMHQTTQSASELTKSIQDTPTADGDLQAEVKQLKLGLQARQWMDSNNITQQQDLAMGQFLTDNPQKAMMLNYGLLTFDDVFAMSGASRVDADAMKAQGKKEALQSLASKQAAVAPRGNASAGTAAPSEDPILAVLQSD